MATTRTKERLNELRTQLGVSQIRRSVWESLLTPEQAERLDESFDRSSADNIEVWAHHIRRSPDCAIIDLAHEVGLLITAEYLRLRKAVGWVEHSKHERIRWDSAQGVLTVDGRLARSVASQARRVRAVLDAFEKAEWLSQIPNPLPSGVDVGKTLGSLNAGLNLITFHEVGNGIRWSEKSH